MKKYKISVNKIWFLFVLLVLAIGCQKSETKKKNVVIEFLRFAELQIETQDQIKELKRALKDILELQPNQLQERRYSDYQMHKETWTLPQILSAYYVPQQPVSLNSDHFYLDVSADSARSLISNKLTELKTIEIDLL